MGIVRGVAIAFLICTTSGVGCRQDEPGAEPVGGSVKEPVAESPAMPVELSDEQKAAVQRMEAAGAGIVFDEAGFPVLIDLASERVFADEELVRAALLFPNLKGLRLAVSSVPQPTLAELASLADLEELFLQDAAIDDAGLSTLLGSMPNLRRLTLRRLNGVTDDAIDAIVGCKNLEVVALIEMNQLTGSGVEQLAGVPQLRSLDLRNCGRLKAEDFKRLDAFKSLVELKLGGPAVNDDIADVIHVLPEVHSLTIEDAEISAAFFERLASEKATSERLRALAFARSFGVTDEALALIGEFANLETLSLRDIMVSGEFLADLSEAGKGPLPWRTLIVTNAFLDDTAIERLPELAPNVERLDLRGNPGVTGESTATFEKLENLRNFKLE